MSAAIGPNPQQQAAIDHTEGPLRIIAGAGTGKTWTLTRRIENLIEKGLASPKEILALTFTNKATAELRERIDAAVLALGYPHERVAIHTYHAFGATIVSEFGHLLDLPPEPILLTPAEQWILLWRSINEITFDFIDLGDLRPNAFGTKGLINEILSLRSRLTDELRTVHDLHSYLGTMPETDENKKLTDFARAIAVYERKKAEIGAIDYGDQIAMAVQLLQRPDVAEIFHGRYRYLLVDEFQDTNYAQSVLVRLLSPDDAGNVCIVGDPNQAIYLFRGASPDNMERFAASEFRDVVTRPLSLNYRSHQPILDAANAIWTVSADNGSRQPLTSGREVAGERPLYVTAPGRADEIAWVADEVGRLIETETATPGEIMILARSNERKLEFWRALAERGIPAVAVGGDALFALPEIQDVVSWLKAIANRDDNAAFLHILLAERWDLDEADVLTLNAAADASTSLAQRVERLQASGVAPPAITHFLTTLDELTRSSYESTLIDLVEAIIGVRQGAYTPAERQGLNRFLEIATQFSTSRVGNPTLPDLVEYLDLLELAGGEMFEASGAEIDSAVQVMTAHAAKGLQKNVVFVVCAYGYEGKKHNDPLPADLSHPVVGRPQRPPGPITTESDDEYRARLAEWQKAQSKAESQRVFYVAATRAEDLLYVTGSDYVNKPGKKPQSVPAYVAAFAEASEQLRVTGGTEPEPGIPLAADIRSALIKADLDYDRPDIDTALRLVLEKPWLASGGELAMLDLAIRQFLDERKRLLLELETVNAIEQRRLARSRDLTEPPKRNFSYSSLSQFEGCPHRFYLRHIVRLPEKPNHWSTAYGSEFHHLVQQEAERRRAGLPPERIDVQRARLQGSIPPAGSGTEERPDPSFDRDPLEVYLESPDATASPLLIEEEFVLRVGRSRIYGIIDRVHELADGTIEVVDYKTDAQVRTAEQVKAGLQLPIYLLAVREAFSEIQPPPSQAKMFFVRHNEPVTVTYSDEELASARERLERLCDAASAVDPAIHNASPETCKWCGYREICQYSEAVETT